MREDEKMLQRLADGHCRYNDGISCADAWRLTNCRTCGWNPKVQAERKRRRRNDDHRR